MEILCSYCNTTYNRDISKVNEAKKLGRKSYCSKQCQNSAQTKKQAFKCSNCDKDIYKIPAEIKKSKSGNAFCGRSCAISFNNHKYKIGENHPNYKNGRQAYRKLAFSLKEAKCEICGYSNKAILQVHHKDEDRSNNSIDNLEILCPTHHSERHLLK